MPERVSIRPVREDERAAWEPLWQDYLTFYKTKLPPENTDVAWKRFHDPDEPMFLLGAYVDGKLTGIVHYIFHRSTWTPGNYCYLQDLFTAQAARGKGVGRALIKGVYGEARLAGSSRVYWQTHETNVTARKLYDQIAERSGFIVYRKLF